MIKKALKTTDFKNATTSGKLISNEFYKIIKVIRSGILTDEQIKQLVHEFFTNSLKQSKDYRLLSNVSIDENTRDLLIEFFDFYIQRLKGYLNDSKNAQKIEGFVDSFLKDKNISLSTDLYAYKKLRQDFILALIEAYKIEKMRLKGNYNNWYDDFRSSLKKQEVSHQLQTGRVIEKKQVKLLSEVIAEYCKEKIDGKEWNAKNAEETRNFYKQFVEIIGDKDIKEYDRPELVEYRGLLSKFPANVNKHKVFRDLPLGEVINLIQNDDLPPCRILSTKTVNKNLVRINAIFEYAHGRGYIKVNPAYKLKITIKKKKASLEKDPYSKDDIRKLITSPAFVKVNQERPERFWIPLIGLYSGCRLGEISQLYKSDIKEDFGIAYFDINDEEDKVLKTVSSKRLVPISPELLKLGFINYVKSVKHERLWSNLKRRRDGYGHDFSRWYNEYEAKYITDHPKKSFNSFRHNFINQLKQEIAKEKAFALESVLKETVGHSNESITLDRYGKEYLLQVKLELIKKLDYGIDFSHLKSPIATKKG